MTQAPSGNRRSRIFGLCLAGLIGLVVVFYEVELMRGRGAWRDYEHDALGRGVKLKFADYIPPKIPDAENFASTPIFDAIFQASDAGQTPGNPFAFVQYGSEPRLSDLWSQRQTDLTAWQQFLIKEKVLPKAGENEAADVLLALQRFDPLLLELREAGKRPHCRFPVHWEKLFNATLPHLGPLQTASDRFALRLSAHLSLGDSPAAYEDFHDGLRLAIAMREEPSIIAGLVRMSIGAKMVNCVWDGLAKRQWAPPELRKIEADLSGLDWLRDYVFSMSCERGSSNESMDAIIHNSSKYSQALGSFSGIERYVWVSPRGWIYQSKVRHNRFLDELIARVEPGQHRYFGQRPVPSSPANLVSVPQRIHYLMFFETAGALENIETKFVQGATITDEARIACALECFRQKRGAYPESLAELSPEFIAEIPAEVVNGDPYRYRRTKDGLFLLYSVGTDLRDDGGVVNPALRPSKQPDWIWSYPAK